MAQATVEIDPSRGLGEISQFEADAEIALWDVTCLLDGRGVQRGSVVGDLAPVAGVGSVAVQAHVTIGEPGEGVGPAEVIDETMPGGIVAGVVIEMLFEAVGLVAPDGSAGGARTPSESGQRGDSYRPVDQQHRGDRED